MAASSWSRQTRSRPPARSRQAILSPGPVCSPRSRSAPGCGPSTGRATRTSEALPMNYWLFKSEPDAWSWDQQKKEGAKGAEWDGVRNYQARNVMRQMRRGDFGFFYHSGEERRVVGVVKVVAEAHPDSTDGTGIWECVDVAAVSDVPRPVTLVEIKSTKALKDMVLVNNSRLSVQPVSAEEWSIISRIAGLKEKSRS